MKTSELIRELEEVIAQYGDGPVRANDNVRNHEIEVVVAKYTNGDFETHITLTRPTQYGLELSNGSVVPLSQG
jgi:hypothetical protein